MATRRRYTSSVAAAEVRRLRKEGGKIAKIVLRELRAGHCPVGPMSRLNWINATIPNYTTGIKNAPWVPSEGTLVRIRRVYANRCKR